MLKAISNNKPRLLVLVGPTAIGKTKLSLDLAKTFQCEIISGDSMQVYRQMDIGTAKLPIEQRKGIPHHLIDIVAPDEPFSAVDFQKHCRTLIAHITARHRLPFLVGGTGLYIESIVYEFEFSNCHADEAFRKEMEKYAAEKGKKALLERLHVVDPDTAKRLHPNDQRRIIRALEIFYLTGETLSDRLTRQTKKSPYNLCLIGLTMDRQRLYKRIEARVDMMVEKGLINEVHRLLAQGYPRDLVSMQGLGYKEIAAYLQGEMSLEVAIERLKRDTRRFAKRQLSWFRHMRDIYWVYIADAEQTEPYFAQICKYILGKF